MFDQGLQCVNLFLLWSSWEFIGSQRLSQSHMCSPMPSMPTFMTQNASIHVHTCICDCLERFGSVLVNLGQFRGQILAKHLYASRWPPRAHEFSPLYYKYLPYICTSYKLIETSTIGTISMCYFLYCFIAYLVNSLGCEYFLHSQISL